ncbi:hypothetical protein GOP47_0007166 [Adiantum capillus-veneris]|uniref:TPX2 central domain-containing protein n=1 Tax=Adiantum capillus-veneris TaxID=13818 RepID=A0A9D4V103_ADICA|nr:hypothetical protein GOP47_0007166 [Adiantum capillus-veneris]
METGTEFRKAPTLQFHIDLKYEFCAPRFFDFSVGETEEEAAAAERWFTGAVGHPPSPLVGKVKSVQELSTGCSLEEYIEVQKLVARVTPELSKMMDVNSENVGDAAVKAGEGTRVLSKESDLSLKEICATFGLSDEPSTTDEPCTPKEQFPERFVELQSIKAPTNTGRNIPSKYNRPELHKEATIRNIHTLAPSQLPAAKRCLTGPQKVDETHAAKKQKLEEGRSCQMLNRKTPQVAPTLTISQQFRLNAERHACKRQKLEGGRFGHPMHTKTPRAASSLTVPQGFNFHTEKRANIYKETGQCEQAQSSGLPYIPIAEMVQRFQMNLLGEFKWQDRSTVSRKRSLRLTNPKEPILGTSMRARPSSVKSFVEQEEEMLANIPKFRARPLNRRILQGPTLPPPTRSIPQLPEFQEFNLKTMERALMHQHVVPSMGALGGIDSRDRLCLPDIARPMRMKSTRELEQELAMLPKFKARPLDKRIFSSRGDVGVYTVLKRQATKPKEFQFATDLRAEQHDAMMKEQRNQEFDENQSLQQNGKEFEYSSRQWPAVAHIGPLFPERRRKPLGEIQQQFVLEQGVQRPKAEKHVPFSFSHERSALQPHQLVDFSLQSRSVKDFTQHLVPGKALERQVEKTNFPMYFMR